MKRRFFFEVFCTLLVLFFLYSAFSTFFQFASLKNMLAFYTPHTSAVAWTLIVVELFAGSLLIFKRGRIAGLFICLALVVYGAITIVIYPAYPHDFGFVFYFLNTVEKLILLGVLYVITLSCLGLYVIIKFDKPTGVSPMQR